MKKAISLAFVLTMVICLCACGKSNAVKECEALIDEIGEIDTTGIMSVQAEIHMDNSGIVAYEAAKSSYNHLSDKEKEQVENAGVLEEKKADYETAKALWDDLKMQQKIMLNCKENFAANIQQRLKDPASYEERDFTILFYSDSKGPGTFSASMEITYAATNSFGGTIETTARAYYQGEYSDNEFEITDPYVFNYE